MRFGRRSGRLQQLEVEPFRELAAELGALGPPDFGIDDSSGGEIELDLRADGQFLAALDESAAGRDVAQPGTLHLTLVVQQRGTDDAHPRLALRKGLRKSCRPLGGELARLPA